MAGKPVQMYACRRMGKGYTIANARDFSDVFGIVRETTSIKVTKEVQDIFKLIGYNVEKSSLPGGSMWLYANNIQQMIYRLSTLTIDSPSKRMILAGILKFMEICMNNGYDIRFY